MLTMPPTQLLVRPGWAQRAGASAVEFAVAAPILFALLLGMIEVGRGFMATHQLTSAARDACRTAIISGKSNSDIDAVIQAALATRGFTGYTTTVEINDSVANANSAVSNDRITVKITVPISGFTWLPGGSYLSGNIGGQCTLRRE